MDHIGSSLGPVLAYWLTSSATLVLVLTLVAISTIQWYQKHRKFGQEVDKIPGPFALPIVGNGLDLYCAPEEVFRRLVALCVIWGSNAPMVRVWIGTHPIVMMVTAEAAEAVLSSNKHITKSREYRFLYPWLATGLLTSTGEKWHTRRKLLTPAFHFKILEDFMEVFNEQSAILVQKLEKERLQNKEGGFDVFSYITRCTLDIICDSAMGKHVDAQSHEESEYVKAVYRIGTIIQSRQLLPWLQPDLLFKMTPFAAEQKHCLETLHGFTNEVIKERKNEHTRRKAFENTTTNVVKPDDGQEFTKKKRLAFLDLLISASDDGRVLSDADIREEVDTFMFEGHDTTAAGISWCMFLIGSYPKIQAKVYKEIQEVLGDDLDRPITMQDLANLKYLECCIKEAQRLYPSVPIVGRELKEDITIGEFTVPAGCTALIFPYVLHRNASNFPDPEVFMPERFLAENCRGRHPYAYVPFSAGPRNCIGQKFAVMEEKVVLSQVFRRFHVKSIDKRESITLLGELVLRPKNALKIRLTLRPTE